MICVIGKKQDTLFENEKTSVNILSLTSVRKKDSGTYSCHAFQAIPGHQIIKIAQVIIQFIVNIFYTVLICVFILLLGFSTRSDDTSHYHC